MFTSVLLLLLYPLITITSPSAFYFLWPNRRHPNASLASGPAVELEESARLGALMSLLEYGSLLFGTLLLWLSSDLTKSGLVANSQMSNAFVGGYLGVSWAGISIWLLALGAATGKMRREIPGLLAPLKLQLAVWLVGAFAEESWRVIAVMTLLNNRYSPLLSLIAVGVAFGSGYLSLGFQRTAVAILEGVFLGFLFLWRDSFLAPLTAHLAVQAVYLWGIGQLSQDRQSRKTWQIPGTKCPVCRTRLGLLQIKLDEVFECPTCKERLSLSDTYQNVMRFAAALGFGSLILCTLILLVQWLPGNLGAWVTYPVSYGIATSCLFLYRKAFTRLFPPRLQRGTPYFITLSLKDRHETKKTDAENGQGN